MSKWIVLCIVWGKIIVTSVNLLVPYSNLMASAKSKKINLIKFCMPAVFVNFQKVLAGDTINKTRVRETCECLKFNNSSNLYKKFLHSQEFSTFIICVPHSRRWIWLHFIRHYSWSSRCWFNPFFAFLNETHPLTFSKFTNLK